MPNNNPVMLTPEEWLSFGSQNPVRANPSTPANNVPMGFPEVGAAGPAKGNTAMALPEGAYEQATGAGAAGAGGLDFGAWLSNPANAMGMMMLFSGILSNLWGNTDRGR